MAVPTVSAISPVGGPTGGLTLCLVTGTNFQLPPAPPATGPTTAPPPTVRVLFGGVVGTDVKVLSATQLLVLSPIHDLGAVGITVQNIDSSGVLISGEQATLAAAYTYARPVLIDPNGRGVTYMTRLILRELKRQVIPEVVTTVSVDWDDAPGDGLNIAAIASFPALALIGPSLRENHFYRTNVLREKSAPGSTFTVQRPAYTVDLIYQIQGFANKSVMLLNLLHEVHMFFKRNIYLNVQSDSSDSSSAIYRFELDIEPGGDLRIASQPNNADVRIFTGTFLIRGFDMDDPDMVFDKGGVVGDDGVSVDGGDLQQTGGVFPIGPSPGN